jgi:hypothetical protein
MTLLFSKTFILCGMSLDTLFTAWKTLSEYIFFYRKPKNTPLLPLYKEKPIKRRRSRISMASRRQIGGSRYPALSYTKRATYGDYGCTVFGWPSSGGVMIRENCDLVELQYLSLDPLDVPTARYDESEKEDEFCVALRKIGGKWWKSQRRWLDVQACEWTELTEPSREEEREVYIGWPEEGGVLVLDNVESSIPGEVGMLRMVTSMEERCRLLRDRFNAVYYEDTRTYSGFAALGPKRIES